MQTIKIEIEDNIYDNISKLGINIKDEFNSFLEKVIYSKEYKIAQDIKNALSEVKQKKTTNLDKFLNEI
jgi:antitoxin component of RelBE/YafQ-DinJ toxin-antitoxin module